MKISDAKNMCSSQLNSLWSRKRELSKLLHEDAVATVTQGGFDRVELSRELSEVEKQYNATSGVMSQLLQRESAIHNAEVAKQQGSAMADAMDDMLKCLEIARRISEGAKVPAADEKMLMDYSHELYMSAKNMAFLNAQKEQKEYDSLVEEDETTPREEHSASEIAGDAEVDIRLPAVTGAAEAPAAELPAE